MQFTPRSEEEIKRAGLISPGVYPFEVIEVSDRPSRNGNEMITLNLKVWDEKGNERIIRDWLLEVMAHKLKHFADSVGLAEKYQAGNISHTDCLGKKGYVKLIVQEDKTGQYGPQNMVKDYVANNDKVAKKESEVEFFDDSLDVPF